MKFPRFIPLAKHKQFNLTPRYYDPIKEDIKIRTEKIRQELNNSQEANYPSHIRGSFDRKITRESNAGFLRIIIFLAIVGGIGLYAFYGDIIEEIFQKFRSSEYFFYFLALIFSVYVYFRLRGRLKK